MSFNYLTGAIPPALANLSNLKELWLRGSRLTGPVPPQLEELDNLSILRLAGNDLAPPFPLGLYEVYDNDLTDELFCRRSPRMHPELLGDCILLLVARDELAGQAPLNWDVSIPLSAWQGVTVGGPEGRVRQLRLANLGLTGRIAPELGRLHRLVVLNLGDNRLTGPIPPELEQLADLRELRLGGNAFTGPVPPGLYRLPVQDLTDGLFCRRSPRMHPELLSDCTLLLATRDELAGRAPLNRDELAGQALLNWNVNIPINAWQGVTVGGPEGRVRQLRLANLGLTGRIAPELGRLPGLVVLNLGDNQLTGPIPPELEQLANLRELKLGGNALTGPIPPGLYRLPVQDLTDELLCQHSPRIHPELLGDCTLLLAARGELAGQAPLNWDTSTPISAWQGVTVGGPEGRVIALELPRRRLDGRIPAALGGLTRLRSLVLDGNRLTGAIPPELGRLTDLQVLSLATNDLGGPVPTELARLSKLRDVWLNDNPLTGPVPPELESVGGYAPFCPAAPYGNPGLRADCALLLAVKDALAGDAMLNWSARLPLAGWHGVTLGGPPERVTRLELPKRNLNGKIPPGLGRLGHLVSLDLSDNQLAGSIPSALGELQQLVALRLDRNRLTGPVPAELGKLPKLMELQLQENDLAGPVPPQLHARDTLSLLRLAGNDPERSRLHDLDGHEPGISRSQQANALGNVGGRETQNNLCRPASAMPPALLADCTLLLAVRDKLAGQARLNWSENLPIEFWQGVSTGASPRRVLALELPRAGLNGHLVEELGELSGLVALDLRHNRLTGPIPSTLGVMDTLSFLRLAGNDLDYSFPPTLHAIKDHDLDRTISCHPAQTTSGLLADCTLLLAVRDGLAGDAPLNWSPDVPIEHWQGVTMDRLRNRVTALELAQLGLNGRIPPALGRLDGLVSLRLSRNRLAGPIPPELGSLVRLRKLWLDDNRLSGPLPPELGRLSGLAELRFDADAASTGGRSGPADESPRCRTPATLLYHDCSTLLEVRDRLAGDVGLNWSAALPIDHWRGVTLGFPPDDAGAVTQEPRVVALELSHLGLNGRIPAQLSALDALAGLHLGDNRLKGSIPTELGALSGLRALTLENNALTGTIPAEFGALQQLVWLRLGGNELSGPVPEQIATLADLQVLSLENNALSGSFPDGLSKLEHLEVLRLENNRLHGRIPRKLSGLPRLTDLRLDGNGFINCIPLTWHMAQASYDNVEPDLLCQPPPWRKPALSEDVTRLLRTRDVLAGEATLNWSYDNPVESWQGVILDRRGRIFALDLRGMNLDGRIPPELGGMSGLKLLKLGDNRLTGPIPPELRKLTRLQVLALGDNNLSGPIPPGLGELLNLRQLWLHNNRLSGPIPPGLGELLNLRQLWLHDNRLSGPIPPGLGELLNLRQLWLHNNRLSGPIPAGLEPLDNPWVRVANNDIGGVSTFAGYSLDCGTFLDSFCAALQNQRLLIWRRGLEKALEAPLFGHGLGTFVILETAPIGYKGTPVGVHNLYLLLLGEAGIIPALLFILSLILLLRAQWGAPKSIARDATTGWLLVIALNGMTSHYLLLVPAVMFLAGLFVVMSAARDEGDLCPAQS